MVAVQYQYTTNGGNAVYENPDEQIVGFYIDEEGPFDGDAPEFLGVNLDVDEGVDLTLDRVSNGGYGVYSSENVVQAIYLDASLVGEEPPESITMTVTPLDEDHELVEDIVEAIEAETESLIA